MKVMGHAMTYLILTDDTNKVISRSGVRSADKARFPNLRLERNLWKDDETEEIQNVVTNSQGADKDISSAQIKFNPEEIVGKTLLVPGKGEDERRRIRIAELIDQDPEPGVNQVEGLRYRAM